MAANRRPLPDLGELLSTGGSVTTKSSSLPKLGTCDSRAWASSTGPEPSATISSTADCSARRLDFSLSISSWVEEGAAALRASGSSHDGIFNGSSSSGEVAEGGAIFAGSAGFTSAGARSVLFADCKISAKGSNGLLLASTGVGGADTDFSSGFSVKSKLESCSCKRAVCCLSASVCGSAAAGEGRTKLGSGAADILVTSTTGSAAGSCVEGAKMEAGASGVRGKSNVEETGPTGLTGTAFTGSSGMSEAGVSGTSETGAFDFGAAGISVKEAGGAIDLDSESFGSAFLAMPAEAAGLEANVLGTPFAGGGTTTGATGRSATGAAVTGEPSAGGELTGDCGADPMRSPGKRMPQKPTTDSVNSSST